MPEGDVEVTPEDAIQVAQRALVKSNETEELVASLEEELADVKEDLTGAMLRLSEIDDERDYRDLTRNEKIGMVREYAFERASSGRGRTFDVTDIREGLFDGAPSRDHCYDLMEWAAEARGFEYNTPASRNYHLTVDPDEAKRGVLYSATTREFRRARSG
jgi:hypothetical protein